MDVPSLTTLAVGLARMGHVPDEDWGASFVAAAEQWVLESCTRFLQVCAEPTASLFLAAGVRVRGLWVLHCSPRVASCTINVATGLVVPYQQHRSSTRSVHCGVFFGRRHYHPNLGLGATSPVHNLPCIHSLLSACTGPACLEVDWVVSSKWSSCAPWLSSLVRPDPAALACPLRHPQAVESPFSLLTLLQWRLVHKMQESSMLQRPPQPSQCVLHQSAWAS